MVDNIFDLDKKTKPKKNAKTQKVEFVRKHPPKEYSMDDKIKKTKGYNKWSNPKEWPDIPKGTHIRLVKRNGKFLTGGFVKTFYEKDEGGHFILENRTFNRDKKSGYIDFPVHFKDIKNIFVKRDDKNKQDSTKKTSKTEKTTDTPDTPDNVPNTAKAFDVIVRGLRTYNSKVDKLEEVIVGQRLEIEDLKKRLDRTDNFNRKVVEHIKDIKSRLP